MKTGMELIADERARQIDVHKWTPEHDSEHDDESLVLAAMYYACPNSHEVLVDALWPRSWHPDWAKRQTEKEVTTANRTRDLAKAGALIAAEIDRINATKG